MSWRDERKIREALAYAERQAVHSVRRKSSTFQEAVGISGFGVAHTPEQTVPFWNLITTPGDQYYAKMAIALVSPANAAQPTKANGMKLGTSTTAATKSGSAAALVAGYISGSNVAFDATYPQAAAVAGTDTGWYGIYQTTWAAGTATSATINEVVIVNDQGTNATSTAANTYARAVLPSTVNKTSTIPLVIIWNHKFLGA